MHYMNRVINTTSIIRVMVEHYCDIIFRSNMEKRLNEKHTVLFFLLIIWQVLLLVCDFHPRTLRLLVEIREVDTFKPNVSNNRFCNSDALSSVFLSIHKSMIFRCNSFSFTLAGFTVLRRRVKIPQDLCLLRKL